MCCFLGLWKWAGRMSSACIKTYSSTHQFRWQASAAAYVTISNGIDSR